MTDQHQMESIDRDPAIATSKDKFIKRTNEKLIFQINVIDFILIAFIVKIAERYLQFYK